MELAKEISLDSIVGQMTGLVAADMDREKVMLDIENGKYYGLDGIGSRIWALIEKPCTAREMVAVLQKEYDVEEKVCQENTLTFLSTLYAKGLVDID